MSAERVAVLAGGRSPEREVSLRSGHRVMTALRSRGFDAIVVDPAEQPLVEALSAATVSACYVALHGKEGEDGTAQRLLMLLDIPFTGSEPFACETTFDKVLAKDLLSAAEIPTPSWAVVEAAALRDLGAGATLHRLAQRVSLPAVVKPSRAGSAMGMSFVEREADLPHAVMNALSFSEAAIVERRIDGVEVAASMLGSP
jgi:D-alanine-D-alanine ligase